MSIETMKLALDEFENQKAGLQEVGITAHNLDELITALRQAIEQHSRVQTQMDDIIKTLRCPNCVSLEAQNTELDAKLAAIEQAQKQEPVAKVCHDLDGHIGWNPSLKELPDEGAELYTSSPYVATLRQRQPLTDEELMIALLHVDSEAKRLPIGFRAFARAIEAAHGIKGEA